MMMLMPAAISYDIIVGVPKFLETGLVLPKHE